MRDLVMMVVFVGLIIKFVTWISKVTKRDEKTKEKEKGEAAAVLNNSVAAEKETNDSWKWFGVILLIVFIMTIVFTALSPWIRALNLLGVKRFMQMLF